MAPIMAPAFTPPFTSLAPCSSPCQAARSALAVDCCCVVLLATSAVEQVGSVALVAVPVAPLE